MEHPANTDAESLSRQAAGGVGIPCRARTGWYASAASLAGCMQPEFPATPLPYVRTVCGTAALQPT